MADTAPSESLAGASGPVGIVGGGPTSLEAEGDHSPVIAGRDKNGRSKAVRESLGRIAEPRERSAGKFTNSALGTGAERFGTSYLFTLGLTISPRRKGLAGLGSSKVAPTSAKTALMSCSLAISS